MPQCNTCHKVAEHQLSYDSLVDGTNWIGFYCTRCFIIKLRGMTNVWNSKVKKYCEKCNAELTDKRSKKCDYCLGLKYRLPISEKC